MLLWLTDYLAGFTSAFGVFRYLTLRTVVSALTAFAISLMVGPRMIRALSKRQIGEKIRAAGPESHQQKAGTPTMGGMLILVSIIVATLLWGDLTNRYVWIALGVVITFGAVGWVDDYVKLSGRSARGLPMGWKYAWQSVFGFLAAVALFAFAGAPAETSLHLPFLKDVAIPLGVGFVFLAYLVIVFMSNAVNLTDGLDGLATLPTVMVAGALGLVAYLSGHLEFADYLRIPYIAGAGELTVFCGALIGAGLGFLWFNAYPAQLFMGDVGALALGAALGLVAVVVRHEVVLLIMGGLFVVEAVSVIVQVASYRLTGKRVFRMAPIHHHFELLGWPESRIIVRMWIVTLVLVLVGLSTLKLR